MLKINRKVEYSLIALKFISSKNPNQLTSTREICTKFQIPFDTMAKIMQLLHSNNILQSQQGIKGGYSLKISLDSLSYLDLIKIIEGKTSNVKCTGSLNKCPRSSYCNISDNVQALDLEIYKILNTLSLNKFFSNNL